MQRDEVFKSQCHLNLLTMLDRGDVEERHAAIGALGALAKSEKHVLDILSNKVGGCGRTGSSIRGGASKVAVMRCRGLITLRYY